MILITFTLSLTLNSFCIEFVIKACFIFRPPIVTLIVTIDITVDVHVHLKMKIKTVKNVKKFIVFTLYPQVKESDWLSFFKYLNNYFGNQMDVKELLWSYVCVCLTSIKCLRSTIYSQKMFKLPFSIINKMVNLELIYGLCLSKL